MGGDVGRTECNEFRQWIAFLVDYAVTRSTRYGLRFGRRMAENVGRTECNEFRQWIAFLDDYSVTRSTRYGLRRVRSR